MGSLETPLSIILARRIPVSLRSLANTNAEERKTMIEIILTLCLLSNPSKCRDEQIPLTQEANLWSCLLGAQVDIAKQMELRPRWAVKKWKCQQAGLTAKL